MKDFMIIYALNKNTAKEPLVVSAHSYTEAYVTGMTQLPTDAEITGVFEVI